MNTDLTQPGLERLATRTALARQLLGHVERLLAQLGTVPLATEIQLLKRDLSRGHDLLRACGETSFLSVVTLVESALACLTWKQYTPQVVDTLRQAFTVGEIAAPLHLPTTTPSVGSSLNAASLRFRVSISTPSKPKTLKMARKANRRYLLDTSAVIYRLHGHTLQRAAVNEAVADGTVEVPLFVRMEYLRGVIVNLIDLHGLIKESISVEDALIDWAQLVRQERKLKVVLLTVSRWLESQDAWSSRDRSLERLGDLIFRLIWSFDEVFSLAPIDPLACVLGQVSIDRQDYEDELLLDFYERFRAIRQGVPNCGLCTFRHAQRCRFRRRKLELTTPKIRGKYGRNLGFLYQLDVLQEAEATKNRVPGCRWCERLGASIIALQAGQGVRIVTADRTFVGLGEVLNVSIVFLPSLAELKWRGEN